MSENVTREQWDRLKEQFEDLVELEKMLGVRLSLVHEETSDVIKRMKTLAKDLFEANIMTAQELIDSVCL